MVAPIKRKFRFVLRFYLGKLPRQKEEWFVDASKLGFGGGVRERLLQDVVFKIFREGRTEKEGTIRRYVYLIPGAASGVTRLSHFRKEIAK